MVSQNSDMSAVRLDRFFREVKQEGPEARSLRCRSLFERLSGATRQIVLFGAGPFGQWVLDRLRRAGIEPCCFSDNNKTKWGTRLKGIDVLSPAEAISRFGTTSAFIVTVYNGSAARDQLRHLNCPHVVHAAALFWKYPDQFMPDLGIDRPDFLVEQEAQIRNCFARLADESSRQELCDQLEWRYWMTPEFLPLPQNEGELYFPTDLVLPNKQEIFVDCGAFDGDSVRALARRGQAFSHIYALEPDPANRDALQSSAKQLFSNPSELITIWPYAVSNQNSTVSFTANGSVTSRLDSTSDGGVQIECRTLDSLPWSQRPTYIKMDIEGAEPDAIEGGAAILREDMPVLAICLYHRSEHLWQIPNLISSIQPSYSLFLRRYAEDCWETVCYAVPQHRLVQK